MQRSPWSGRPLSLSDSVIEHARIDDLRRDPPPLDLLSAAAQVFADASALQHAAALLIDEAGKTAADAASELALLPTKIHTTLNAMSRTPTPGASGDGQPTIHWRARGLALALGPFNFPLHLLHGMVMPALATGNRVIAKMSERTPGLAAWYAERIAAASLAPWCAVLCGGAEVASALIDRRDVATIALVGSRRTAQRVAQRIADRPEVVLAAEMGGVNHALFCDSADCRSAIAAIADGAWRMAGQRCTATRVAWVPRRLLATCADALRGEAAAWRASGDPNGRLGPLIDQAARDHAVSVLHQLRALDGVSVHGGDAWGHAGLHPALVIANAPPPALREELFAPVLCLCPYDDVEQAVHAMQANPQRLACAVWTADRAEFSRLAAHLPYGQCYHNRSTAGARGDLPFGGCGLSGNGRAAALSAARIFADETVVW